MSLNKMNLSEVTKKQYMYKLKANKGSISSLIFAQLIAILFSFNGTAMSGSGTSILGIELNYFNSDLVFAFSLIWAFITAVTITTKDYRNAEFSFINNRLSSTMSDVLFLGTMSILAGITTFFSGFLLQDLLYFLSDSVFINQSNFLDTPIESLFGIVATILYLWLVSAIGYLIGSLVQLHKIFVVVIPALLLGISLISISNNQMIFLAHIGMFFMFETSFWLFVLKTITASALCFYASFLLFNRMEVRK